MEKMWWELEERTFGGLDAEERLELHRLLAKIRKNLVEKSADL